MLVLLKVPFIAALVVLFVIASLVTEVFYSSSSLKRHLRAYQTHLCSRILLFILGVSVTLDSEKAFFSKKGALLVSNHLSYLDVFILSSVHPIVFVTSKEVEESGFLGLMSKCAGSLFVERRKKNQIGEEISVLSSVIDAGNHVAVFPEGTTSSGDRILPFKSSFFDAAVRTRCSVLPVCINYKSVNSTQSPSVWKNSLFYYGTMEFIPHFLRVLSLKSVEVTITVTSPIAVDSSVNRKDLSFMSYSKIVSHYKPVV